VDPLAAYRRRLARDDGATEIIGYVFMFAIGAMALVFAMDVLTDAQERGNDVAAAKQAEQLGQVTGSLVEQAARVGSRAPNATYVTHYELPDTIGEANMTVEVTTSNVPGATGPCSREATLHVHSSDERVSTQFPLGNVSTVQILDQCLRFEGELDTSAQAASVRYDPPAERYVGPVIVLEPTSKVR
jgi:hypothetical protein